MPIHSGNDAKGSFYQWGNSKKYYFKTPLGEQRAWTKVKRQQTAINLNKLRAEGRFPKRK
jgi:hypothetical protein